MRCVKQQDYVMCGVITDISEVIISYPIRPVQSFICNIDLCIYIFNVYIYICAW